MKKQLLFIAIFVMSLSFTQNIIAQTDTVFTVGNSGFNPSILTVNIGDTVVFWNTGGGHNVNFLFYPMLGSSGNPVGPGLIWSVVFNVPSGTYDYQCDPHAPGMSGQIIVNPSSSPTITSIIPTDPLCSGDFSGDVNVNINQSNPPIDLVVKLLWQNPNNGFWVNLGTSYSNSPSFILTFDFLNLGAGDYRVDLIDDATGALIEDDFFTLVNPPVLNVTVLNAANPSTPISSDGSIDITVSGGTPGIPPYTYSWVASNGGSVPLGMSNNEDLTGLIPGTYSCTIVDGNGCDSTISVTLTASGCGAGLVETTNVSCYSERDGEIHASLMYGVYPFSISVRDTSGSNTTNIDTIIYNIIFPTSTYDFIGGTGASFDYAIGQRTYEYIFTDATGCSDTLYPIVGIDGTMIVVNDTIISLVTDPLNPDGAITLNNISGGYPNGNIPPYNYDWYDANGVLLQSSSSNTLSSLDTGMYTVIITDNGPWGCSSDPITLQMSLQPPCTGSIISASLTNNLCPAGNSGEVSFNLGSGYTSQLYDSDSIPVGISSQTSFYSLSTGDYYWTLDSINGSGCEDSTIYFEILEPIIDSIHIVNAVSGNNLCGGDSSRIFIEISNIDTSSFYNYSYTLWGGSVLGNVVEDTSSFYLAAATATRYLHLVYTNMGTYTSCNDSTFYFTISEYNIQIDSVDVTDVVCGVSEGQLEIFTTADNNPLTYYTQNYSDSLYVDSNFTGLFPTANDTLLVSVVDDLGCIANWNSPVVVGEVILIDTLYTLTRKETCREDDGYLEVVASNGQTTGPNNYYTFALTDINYTLINTQVTDTFRVDTLDEGTYFLSITDDANCVALDTIIIEHVVEFEIASLTKTKETCCGYDGSLEVNITPGDGTALLYTLRFDTSAVNIFSTQVWPSSLYVDTFNREQNNSLFSDLTRGYYHVYVEDEYGCVDSVDYVSYFQGFSSINTQLGIDVNMQIDMDFSYTDVICYDDTNATVKLLYPDECYNYELWFYHDTTSAQLIATDSIRVSDTLVYYNALYAGIYGIQGMSNSGHASCVRRSDTFEIIEPSILEYDAPLSTAAFCLNGGFEIDGGACNGTVWLPNTPYGGVSDTSVIQSDTVFQYYINRVNSSTPYFQGPILSDSVFTGLCPGEYEVQVFDGNNCMIKDTVEVSDSSLYIDSFVTTNISCFDSSDATIEVLAHGGVHPYYYEWTDSNGVVLSDTIAVIDSLLEGVYNVTVLDSTGCFAIGSSEINPAPDSLILTSRREDSDLDETCLGYTYDGRVGFEVRGGTGPYTFNWIDTNGTSGSYVSYGVYCDTCTSYQFDGANIDSIYMLDSLTTGIYDVTLTDLSGCISFTWMPIDSVRINAANRNNPLSIDSIMGWQDTLCYGAISADIIFYMNDSSMWPLLFELDSGNATLVSHDSIFSSLSANEYDILITDSFGCFIEDKITIVEHSEIIIDLTANSVSCFGFDDGSVLLQVSQVPPTGLPTPAYSYAWSTGATTQNLNNLLEGTYTVTVTDTNFSTTVTDTNYCTATNHIYVGEPDPLQPTITTMQDALCNGSADASGSISLDTTGTPPYSYSWTDASGSVVSTALDSLIFDVIAGTYLCAITDANGCEDTIILTLNEPTVVVLESVDTTQNLCNGDANGEIIVIASGGTPGYSDYTIKGSNLFLTQQSNIFSNLMEDETGYYFWVFDANNCSSDTIGSIKIGDPDDIELIPVLTDLTCFESQDGVIDLTFVGGIAPYTYELYFNGVSDNSGTVYTDGEILINDLLLEGTYYFKVSDYNNCKDSIDLAISQPNQVVADFTISEDLILKNDRVDVVNLSSGANTYLWNFGDGTANVEVVETDHKYTNQGTYEIMLVASHSTLSELCNDTAYASIDVEGYNVTNVFTPNGDGVNDVFQFTDEMLITLNVSIFNRWGQQVFGFENVNGIWDGAAYNGEILPDGVYFFTMEATGSLGDSYIEEGTITIIK